MAFGGIADARGAVRLVLVVFKLSFVVVLDVEPILCLLIVSLGSHMPPRWQHSCTKCRAAGAHGFQTNARCSPRRQTHIASASCASWKSPGPRWQGSCTECRIARLHGSQSKVCFSPRRRPRPTAKWSLLVWMHNREKLVRFNNLDDSCDVTSVFCLRGLSIENQFWRQLGTNPAVLSCESASARQRDLRWRQSCTKNRTIQRSSAQSKGCRHRSARGSRAARGHVW